MAVSNQIECPTRIGCATTVTSPTMMVQRPTSPIAHTRNTKGVSAIIATILNALIWSYKRYQSRTALRHLTNDQLRDIGLERLGNDYRPRDEFLNRF